MRVVFYDCGYETFAVQYLISVLKNHGHDVQLAFDSSFSKDYLAQDFFLTAFFSLNSEQIAKEILKLIPEIVCFSMLTIYYQNNLEVIRHLKKARPELIIICGGFHPTLFPHLVLKNPEIDFLILGEAEKSLPDLVALLADLGPDEVKSLPQKRLPGVWNEQNGLIKDRGFSPIPHNLDQLPFPEKAMYYKENPALAKIYTILTSRGCPGSCTFCNSPTMKNIYHSYSENYYRVRSVASVISELKEARQRFRPKYVMFLDNLFAAQKDWLKEFSRRYRDEIGLPYYCQTSPSIHDQESLEMLSQSRCVLLELGFQSANDAVRRKILNRPEKFEAMRALVVHAKNLGIFTEIDIIVNLPGETRTHLEENLRFIRETRPHWVNLAFLMYLPKASINDLALKNSMISQSDISQIEEGRYTFNMRLLANPKLGKSYRIFPFQVFAASHLPPKISPRITRLLEQPLLRHCCSAIASLFIYSSRIILCFTDRRDFLIRHHVYRSAFAAGLIIKKKWKDYAG